MGDGAIRSLTFSLGCACHCSVAFTIQNRPSYSLARIMVVVIWIYFDWKLCNKSTKCKSKEVPSRISNWLIRICQRIHWQKDFGWVCMNRERDREGSGYSQLCYLVWAWVGGCVCSREYVRYGRLFEDDQIVWERELEMMERFGREVNKSVLKRERERHS